MIRQSLRKLTLTAAAGAVALTAALLAAPGAAQANGPTYRIAPQSNEFLYFDVAGGSKGDGAKIILWSLSGDNQLFTLQPSGSHFELVNKNSGKCITTDGVAGDQLYQWVCKGADNQLWDTGLAPGTYTYSIFSVSSGLAVDINGDRRTQGAAVDTWYWQGTDNQWFMALGS